MSSERVEAAGPWGGLVPGVGVGRAWVFPGVGVKPSGFELTLAERFPREFQAGFDRTAACSGRQFWPTLLDGSFAGLDGLDEQLFSFSFAAVMAGLVGAQFGPPAVVAGNSFGVYPAVQAAGALSWEACIELLTAAYREMEAAATTHPASICAVVGLELAELAAIVKDEGLAPLSGDGGPSVASVLHINSANDTCHIWCGPPEAISRLDSRALAKGALSVSVLPLALPYHHPGYHHGEASRFRGLAGSLDWNPPRFPVVSTIDCRHLTGVDALVDFVARQVFEPIDWAAVVRHFYDTGIAELFECGPGVSLTQNARFVQGEAKWHNCRNLSRGLNAHG